MNYRDFAESLTAQQKRELSAKLRLTTPYMMDLLRNNPQNLKMWQSEIVEKFAEELKNGNI